MGGWMWCRLDTIFISCYNGDKSLSPSICSVRGRRTRTGRPTYSKHIPCCWSLFPLQKPHLPWFPVTMFGTYMGGEGKTDEQQILIYKLDFGRYMKEDKYDKCFWINNLSFDTAMNRNNDRKLSWRQGPSIPLEVELKRRSGQSQKLSLKCLNLLVFRIIPAKVLHLFFNNTKAVKWSHTTRRTGNKRGPLPPSTQQHGKQVVSSRYTETCRDHKQITNSQKSAKKQISFPRGTLPFQPCHTSGKDTSVASGRRPFHLAAVHCYV